MGTSVSDGTRLEEAPGQVILLRRCSVPANEEPRLAGSACAICYARKLGWPGQEEEKGF